MDIDLAQDSFAAVDEFVGFPGAHDKNFSGAGFSLLPAHCPFRTSFDYINHFIVVVLMQSCSLTGFSVHWKKRDGYTALCRSHKFVRHSDEGQLRLMNRVHALFDSEPLVHDSATRFSGPHSWPHFSFSASKSPRRSNR